MDCSIIEGIRIVMIGLVVLVLGGIFVLKL